MRLSRLLTTGTLAAALVAAPVVSVATVPAPPDPISHEIETAEQVSPLGQPLKEAQAAGWRVSNFCGGSNRAVWTASVLTGNWAILPCGSSHYHEARVQASKTDCTRMSSARGVSYKNPGQILNIQSDMQYVNTSTLHPGLC